MNKPEYIWDGSAIEGYIIFRDGKRMEPGEVIDLLNEREDLIEQERRRVEPVSIAETVRRFGEAADRALRMSRRE